MSQNIYEEYLPIQNIFRRVSASTFDCGGGSTAADRNEDSPIDGVAQVKGALIVKPHGIAHLKVKPAASAA